jgi:hypothetical protein
MRTTMSRPEGTISTVCLWTNGMVAVFDEDGEQMLQYQGRASEVAERIQRDAGPDCDFLYGAWRGGQYKVSRSKWAKLAAEAKVP